MKIMADKNEWGSNLSFILAMIGSAVGLGNIWRYPYVLYSNGGGAFYIPYIVAILLMGIPFLILEYGVGYNFKSSFPKAIRKIHSNWEYLGWLLPVAVFMIMIYYSAILGWDGIYMILSFTKGWGANPDTFFANTLLQSSESMAGLTHFIPLIAVATIKNAIPLTNCHALESFTILNNSYAKNNTIAISIINVTNFIGYSCHNLI